eukprot:gene17787-18006_t
MFKSSTSVLAMSCALFALAAGTSAMAQAPADPAKADTGLQEIVVTAQKRVESAQNVPIAISVFSGKTLAERAVGNVSQLASVAPNVNFDNGVAFTGTTAVLAASIRGIGSSDFAFNIDPGVGVYVDGIYLAHITKGRFEKTEARGAVDIPVTSQLTSLITFDVRNSDGYAQRLAFPSPLVNNSPSYTAYPQTGYESPMREGGGSNSSLRGKLKYDGGNFRLTFSADYQYNTETAAYSLLQVLNDPAVTGSPNFAFLYNTCRGAPLGVLQSLGLMNLCSTFGTQYASQRRGEVTPVNIVVNTPGVNTGADPSRYELLYTNQFITGNPNTTYANGNNFSKLWNLGFTLNGEVDLSPGLVLKSITGYRSSHWRSGLDGDGSPLDIFQLSFYQHQAQVSQEFQLVGNALDHKLNYVGGLYFFTERGYLLDQVSFAGGMDQIDGPNWFKTTNYATFAQIDYRLSDLIGITLGARYTHENKDFEGGQQEVNGLFYKLVGSVAFAGTPLGNPALGNICADTSGNVHPDAPLLGGATCRQVLGYPTANNPNPLRIYPTGINNKVFNNFSPKIGAMMVYGSFSAGYKTGGWTTRYTTPQTAVFGFNPEKADTFEVGLKSTWFGRKLQVNLAAFDTNYRGIQLNYQVGTSPTIANVGNARIKGVEFEVNARPTSILTLNASLGYTDAHYTYLDPAVQVTSAPTSFEAGATVGGTLPKTPHWKVNLGPRIDLPLNNGGKIAILGDYTYTSAQRNNVEGTFALDRPATNIVNASLIYTAPGDRYTLTVGGTNLTNERYVTSGSAIPASGVMAGAYNRPMEWYVRAGFKF